MQAIARLLSRRASFAGLLLALLASAVAAPAFANITDDFNRTDGAALGNGWIEKNPAIFSIASNQVQKNAQSSGYLNNIVYRPASEDVADVEASVEMRVLAANPGYPQLFTRVQSATVAGDSTIDGYILFVNDNNAEAILGRQIGSSWVITLGTLALSPALNQTDTYRLRMRATGTNPVQLNAYVERLNSGTWQIIGQAAYNDTSPDRFATAGTVGFGGYIESSYRYDNFVRTNLGGGGGNPVPSTSSLQPNTALAGESGLTLTVNGGNFVAGSVVRWNGANRTTTFVSASVLEAQISAADLAAAGTASVSVFTPTPGGGTSNAQTFTITSNPTPNPVPAITTLAPNNANAGSAAFTLTVNGSNFASNATVRWNGANRTTTFVSSAQLTAAITAADIAAAGAATVTVFNPAPGGGTSNGATFTINAPSNPVPVASALNPSSATAGGGGFTLTVTGSSFVNGATVRWNGANRATVFVSSTQLTATINAADIGAAGNQSVTVFNPTPGGGTSNALTFIVNAGGGGGGTPVIAALSPISSTAGGGSTQVTLNGTGFTSSSVIRWNGSNRTTTFLSATQVRFTASSSDLANAGIAAITVNNPGAGGGTSQPLSFFIQTSGNPLFADTFNRANNSNIGNNWTEKTPAAFSIQSNEVRNSGDNYPFTYRDNLVYRPSSEDQLNVEASIEFIRGANANFPQVHARVQRNSITQPGIIEGYILYVDDYLTPMALAIAVQPPVGINECTLRIMEFPTPLVDGTRYRIRFLVQNSYPVQLTGILERFDGNAWQVFVSGSFTHDNNTPMNPALFCPYQSVPLPVTSAGAVGFSKWYDPVDTYDNFHWRSLGGGGGVTLPSLTSLSPNSATSGGPAFTLTLNGSNFNATSVARWNGSNRTTTFISASQLQAAIPASDIAAAGNASVTVFNPGGGGGISPQTLNFAITPPVTASFVDDFARADSDSLGNGWIEKAPSAFFLEGGQASKQSFVTDYTNSLVYRPAAEDLLNIETSVQMRLRSTSPGYPQLIARMLSSTAANAGAFDGYILYVDDNTTRAYLGRQRGSSLASLSGITISPALTTADTYRLRMSVTGTTSVQIQAFIERLNGVSWSVIGQASYTDTSAQRISGPGTVGFSGYIENSYTYDNFTRSSLGP